MYDSIAKFTGKFRLRIVLIVPFVLLTFGAVGLVGYLSFINGQKGVNKVAAELRREISDRVQQYLKTYLATPHIINRINIDAVRLGQLDLQNLPQLERHLSWQLKQFESVSGTIYGSNRGKFISLTRYTGENTLLVSDQIDTSKIYHYRLDSQGNRGKLLRTFRQPDARKRPWYKAAEIAGKPTWTPIFKLGDNSGLSLNATRPILATNNELLGVFSTSLSLRAINTYLNSLRVGRSGEVFIMERNGLLVATSTKEKPYLITTNQFKRFQATESSNPLISGTGRYLTKQFGRDFRSLKKSQQLDFEINGEHQFVQVVPYQDEYGLDWIVVVVIPESDFMNEIDVNTHTTITLCLVTLIISIIVGILTARWITKPILHLNTAAKDIAKGEWDKVVEINRFDEVGELAESFKIMAGQLQASFRALKASENRLTQLLEALPIGVGVYDITGKLTYANQAAKQLLGVETLLDSTREELAVTYQVYRSNGQPYPVEEMPSMRALLGEVSVVEDMELRRGDQIIPIQFWSSPIYDENGEIILSVAAFANITERQQAQKVLAEYNEVLEQQVIQRTSQLVKLNHQLQQEIIERQQVEQALKDSENKFQEIAQTVNQFFFIRSAITGQFLYVSPAYEKLWGLSCESLYQNPSSWIEALHPDDREMILDSLRTQFQGNPVQREYRIIHADGSMRWITTEISVIRNDAGQVIRFVGLAQDITGRKLAEAALQKSESRWQLAVSAINVGIWDRNYQTGEVFHSARWKEMLGYENHEIENNHEEWKSRLHPDDYDRVMTASQAYLDQQTSDYTIEYRLQSKDSSYKWVLSHGKALWDEQGNLVRFVGSHEDISDRKFAEESLQQSIQREQEKAQELAQALKELQNTQVQLIHAEKMSSLGQMIAGIAHEINNPSSFIQGNLTHAAQYFQDLLELVKLYQRTYPNSTPEIVTLSEHIDLDFLLEDWSKLFGSMKIGVQRISDIVLSLRNFSRLDEKELKSVDLHQGIDHTLLILQHRLKANDNKPEISLVKDYGQLPLVQCYAGQLNQVFMNILSNAIDALENQAAPRIITIKTAVSNQETPTVIVSIADNGSGMSEEVKQKIFDPFFTTKPVGSGTGLGLSISYQIIVEKHQGKIYCISHPGEGTEFVVEIPVSGK